MGNLVSTAFFPVLSLSLLFFLVHQYTKMPRNRSTPVVFLLEVAIKTSLWWDEEKESKIARPISPFIPWAQTRERETRRRYERETHSNPSSRESIIEHGGSPPSPCGNLKTSSSSLARIITYFNPAGEGRKGGGDSDEICCCCCCCCIWLI